MTATLSKIELIPAMEQNMKKALLQMLILQLLEKRECYIAEIPELIAQYSDGAMAVSSPYTACRILEDEKLIVSRRKNSAGRLRQCYKITPKGREQLAVFKEIFYNYTGAAKTVLEKLEK